MKKLAPIDAPTLKNLIRVGRLTLLLCTGITLMLSVLVAGVGAQDESEDETNNADRRDNLVYISDDYDLMLYDPQNRTETKLLSDVGSFVMGRDGRVAFTRYDKDSPEDIDYDLYVYDPSKPLLDPVNITQNPDVNHYPLAWSPDGRYLAFASFPKSSDYMARYDNNILYVWDGESITNIMPEDELGTASKFYVDWSYDGRLAFTIQYIWSNPEIHPEMYVWDGSTTVNLNQNPERWDGSGRWNSAGQLLFGSEREDEEYGIYVWDGISFKDGVPDTDAFIQLPVNLQLTGATWTDDGLVAFTMYQSSAASGMKEIVLWDWARQTIVKRFPVANENGSSWLAEGGQVILSSRLASGTPTYVVDVENTKGELLFSIHTGEFSWSADGYLAYCEMDENRNWTLSIWNGEETWGVARVSYKPVRWQYGRNAFSCNNG